MKQLIIGLCGPAGSGKDTIADRLVEKHKLVKMANADLLKRVARLIFDFTDEQLWGPSELRNAPDKRYPREHGPWVRDCCSCCGMDGGGELRRTHSEIQKAWPQCYLTPRFALQSLGTEWGRMCFENIWIGRLLGIAQELLASNGFCEYTPKKGLIRIMSAEDRLPGPIAGVVISDVRFLNEIEAIKVAGGKIVRVIRGQGVLIKDTEDSEVDVMETAPLLQEQTSLTGGAAQHRSETELLGIPKEKFDYLFQNNGGFDLLRLNVDRTMDVFRGRIMEFDKGLQDAPPFLREKCKELASAMSTFSLTFCAGQDWAPDLETTLWKCLAIPDAPRRIQYKETGAVDQLKKIKELSDAVNGWFTWRDKSYDAPYFIRRSDWLREYEERNA